MPTSQQAIKTIPQAEGWEMLSVRVPFSLKARLDEISNDTGINRQDIVADALRAELDKISQKVTPRG